MLIILNEFSSSFFQAKIILSNKTYLSFFQDCKIERPSWGNVYSQFIVNYDDCSPEDHIDTVDDKQSKSKKKKKKDSEKIKKEKSSKDKKEDKKHKRDLTTETDRNHEKNKNSEGKKRKQDNQHKKEIDVKPSDSEDEHEEHEYDTSRTKETSFESIKRNMWISEDDNIGYNRKEKEISTSLGKKFSLTDHLKIGSLTGRKRKIDSESVKSDEKRRKKNSEKSIVIEENSPKQVTSSKEKKNSSHTKSTDANVSSKDVSKMCTIDISSSSGIDKSTLSSNKRNVILIADDSEESDQRLSHSSLSSRPPSSTPT